MDDKILEIMKRVLELDDVDKNVSIDNCENWDSLHHLMLVSELEEAFALELDPEEIASIKDFHSVSELLRGKVG